MNGMPGPQTVSAPPDTIFYPSEDGEPLAETEAHIMVILTLIATLRQHYADRPDHYVIGDMFLYYEEGNPEARKAPDVMVVKGVEPKPRRDFFKIWEEQASPSVIFEITSPKTADEDVVGKYRLYQQLGVKEYFLFDPRHEYLERPLLGYRLIGKHYEALMHSVDGCLVSNELQMKLCPVGDELVLIDFRTGKRVPTPAETHRLWRDAQEELTGLRKRMEQELVEARQRAEEAERQQYIEQQRAAEAVRQQYVEQQRAAEALRQQHEAVRQQYVEQQRAAEALRQQYVEQQRAAEAVQKQLKAERQHLLEQQRAEEAVRQHLQEQQRAQQAERRAEELAAELARLRSTPPPHETKPAEGG